VWNLVRYTRRHPSMVQPVLGGSFTAIPIRNAGQQLGRTHGTAPRSAEADHRTNVQEATLTNRHRKSTSHGFRSVAADFARSTSGRCPVRR